MLKPWKPLGNKSVGTALLVLATEEHRDALLMTVSMLPTPYHYDHRRVIGEYYQTVNLRGGYGIIMQVGRDPRPGLSAYGLDAFRTLILPWARTFHTEQGRPYAWRLERDYLLGNQTEAGRSPDNRGQNLRDTLKRSFSDLRDRTYKEKGVTYD
jgi:hypothetical protein